MNKFFAIIISGFALLIACSTGTEKKFGTYYKIDKYNIYAPFAGDPHISVNQENKILKMISYQYAYPNPTDDINYLYGLDIFEFGKDSLFQSINNEIDYVAGISRFTYESHQNGKLVNEEKSIFHNKYCVKQKVNVTIPNVGEVIVNSIFISYENIVVRLYTFTPIGSDDNQRIYDFYESIKYD